MRDCYPGLLPANNLPARAVNFVGRESLLAFLQHESEGADGGKLAKRRATCHGLGGAGKTWLALEFAWRHAAHYPGGLWWIAADGRPESALARLALDLRAFGTASLQRLLAGAESLTTADLAARVRVALQSQDAPSLLVLDGVTDGSWHAQLPGNQVRVLATTRDATFALGHVVRVDALSLTEARTLVASVPEAKPVGAAEESACDDVLEHELGGLAVAVRVAAMAVHELGHGWNDYRTALRSHPDLTLAGDTWRADGYTHGVRAALDHSIAGCAPDSAERRLLRGAAVFGEPRVPLEWALAAAGVPDGLDARAALAKIERKALAEHTASPRTISIHPLVRARVAATSSGEELTSSAGNGAEAVKTWLDAEPTALEGLARAPFVIAVLGMLERVPRTFALLFTKGPVAGAWMRALAQWRRDDLALEAYRYQQRAFDEGVKRGLRMSGEPEPRSQSDLVYEAYLRVNAGDLDGAEAVLPKEPDESDWSIWSLRGRIALARARYDDAESALARAADLAHDDRQVTCTYYLGVTALRQQRYPQARDRFEAAVAGNIARHRTELDLDVSASLMCLGRALRGLGDLNGARERFEQSLRIDRHCYGTLEHFGAALAQLGLAQVLIGLGGADEARAIVECVLALPGDTDKQEHLALARELVTTAETLRTAGPSPLVAGCLRMALRARERFLGAEHSDSVAVRTVLARLA